MTILRIAGLQTAGTPSDVEANLAELDAAVARAKTHEVELVITPEMFLTGYDIDIADLTRFTRTALTERVAEIAARHEVAILVGVPEASPSGVTNSAVFLDSRGTRLASHAKTHLYGDLDRAMFSAGDSPVSLVEYRGVKIAMLICYDVEFPENVRAAALAGAHVIAVPTAQMEPFRFIPDTVIPVRAWENQVYVAYVNHVGQEAETVYVGGSSICAPDGSFLARADRETKLIVADIDTEVVAKAQVDNPYLQDRRPDLYLLEPVEA